MIRVRAVPPYLAQAAVAHIVIPRPPLITIPSELPGGGSTTREDPNDGAFKQAHDKAVEEREDAEFAFQLSYGVEIDLPHDDSWIEDIENYWVGYKPTDGPYGLKVDYLKYVVLDNILDALKVRRLLSGMADITPKEVEAVEDSFRDQTKPDSSP